LKGARSSWTRRRLGALCARQLRKMGAGEPDRSRCVCLCKFNPAISSWERAVDKPQHAALVGNQPGACCQLTTAEEHAVTTQKLCTAFLPAPTQTRCPIDAAAVHQRPKSQPYATPPPPLARTTPTFQNLTQTTPSVALTRGGGGRVYKGHSRTSFQKARQQHLLLL